MITGSGAETGAGTVMGTGTQREHEPEWRRT